MKYLFVIGDPSDFDSSPFRTFISHILSMESSKPFQMFMYKFNEEILKIEYPYLCLEGDNKKYLALYPNIILKCKDLNHKVSQNKSEFNLSIGGVIGNSGHVIKSDQIEALTVSKIVVLWENTNDQSQIDL